MIQHNTKTPPPIHRGIFRQSRNSSVIINYGQRYRFVESLQIAEFILYLNKEPGYVRVFPRVNRSPGDVHYYIRGR